MKPAPDYLDTATVSIDGWPKTVRSRQVASRALAKLAKTAPDRAEALLPGIAASLCWETMGMLRPELVALAWR